MDTKMAVTFANIFMAKKEKYKLRQSSIKDVSQVWLVLYKVPFPHEYALEVWQRRVVLRYKG